MVTTDTEQAWAERSARGKVEELTRHFPCVLMTGARQVGKSSLLQHMLPQGMRYVTLDDFQQAEFARNDPLGFLEMYPAPLCIDEVQYAPQLFRAIKIKVDADRRPGMYWMTGSQRFRMMKGVSETLAGRIGIVDLFSLSQQEMYGNPAAGIYTPATPAESVSLASVCDIGALYERIFRGGYPALYRDPGMPWFDYYRDYVQTYVARDVRELTQVGNHVAFMKLMSSAALRTGQQLVYADLARDAGISPKTAAAWVSILVASGIVELLQPYYVNTKKRLSKTPKLYFTDTGLCCWLAGWHSTEQILNSAASGAVLETWVYGQLVRRYAAEGRQPAISYYRDLDGAEVDFVIEQDGGVFPMEVKRTTTPMVADLHWCTKIPVSPWAKLMPPVLFSTAQEARPMPHGAFAFPISAL